MPAVDRAEASATLELHAQDLAARVVVIGELTGGRLDAHVLETLAVEQATGEVERVEVDARVHLGPLRVCRLDAPHRPAGDRQRGQQDGDDVDRIEDHLSAHLREGVSRVYPRLSGPALRASRRRRSRARAGGRAARHRRPSPGGPLAGRTRAPGLRRRRRRTEPRPAAAHRSARRRPRPPRARCRMCRRRPSIVVQAPGHGWRARTCRSISMAGRRQSIQPSARVNGRTIVAARSSCGVDWVSPAAQRSSSAGTCSAARSASWVSSSGVVSRPVSGTDHWATIGPASSCDVMIISVTPPSRSPARIVPATGAAPRCRGSSEGWTFSGGRIGQLEEIVGHQLPVRDEDRPSGRKSRITSRRGIGASFSASPRAGPLSRALARDRRRAHEQPAAGGAVRLADDEQLVGHLRDARQQRDPEGPGPEEAMRPRPPTRYRRQPLRSPRRPPRRLGRAPRASLEVVDVQGSVQVVDLVQQRARQQLLALDPELRAVAVARLDGDLRRRGRPRRRSPGSRGSLPSRAGSPETFTICGFTSSVILSSISMIATCSGIPTWFAARPTPGASRIVSSMSSSSRCRLASNVETFFVRLAKDRVLGGDDATEGHGGQHCTESHRSDSGSTSIATPAGTRSRARAVGSRHRARERRPGTGTGRHACATYDGWGPRTSTPGIGGRCRHPAPAGFGRRAVGIGDERAVPGR